MAHVGAAWCDGSWAGVHWRPALAAMAPWPTAAARCSSGVCCAGHLEVWHAASPLGPWEPHAANPVANGDRGAGFRSAGRLVAHGGRLYRFGQDCGKTYGHRVRCWAACCPAHSAVVRRRHPQVARCLRWLTGATWSATCPACRTLARLAFPSPACCLCRLQLLKPCICMLGNY